MQRCIGDDYADMYRMGGKIRTLDELAERKRRGKMQGSWRMGTTGLDVFNWWMEYDILPGQMNFDEIISMEGDEV